MNVEVRPASLADKSTITRLLQLYLYDFTEFTGEDIEPTGEYLYRYFDNYWLPAEADERFPFIITANGQLAGFAFVRSPAASHDMAEFFVLRKYRRSGVGRGAALNLFARFPGPWKVTQLPANLPAQAFWRRVIGEFTHGDFSDVTEPDHVAQRFTSPPAASSHS
jgi:predicted acetyltransferase